MSVPRSDLEPRTETQGLTAMPIEVDEDEVTPADVAETQIGITEATGHNDGVPADRYMRGDRLAWCAGFVIYCYDVSDWPSLYMNTAGYYRLRNVQAMEDEMKERGCFYGAALANIVWPGDVVFYRSRGKSDKGAGRHVGLVVGVDYDDGKVAAIKTIEGNLSDSVTRRRLKPTDQQIAGFARPHVFVF